MEFNIDNISCLKFIPKNCKHIIIYCHGILKDKTEIINLANKLNNIGFISFDFPSHNNSTRFCLSNCLNYLDKVYNYVINEYKDVKVSILASSFGGYVVLNKILRENNFYKVLLKYPAINFLDSVMFKLNLNESYFDNNVLSMNGIVLDKEAYLEFKKNDLKSFVKQDNVYIIHGDSDNTVSLSSIELFCNKYDIPLTIIKNGHHGLLEFDSEVIKFILESIGE